MKNKYITKNLFELIQNIILPKTWTTCEVE